MIKEILNQKKIKKAFSPVSIRNKLDKKVIAQDEAKKVLSICFFDHIKRMEDPSIGKTTIFIVGPSGSGKTYILESLSEIINIPFSSYDCTSISANSYKGQNIVNVLEAAYITSIKFYDSNPNNSKYQENRKDALKQLTEHSILFLDELDKSLIRKENESVTIIYEMLKLLEGTNYKLFENIDNGDEDFIDVTINTKNILFILGGACSEIQNMERFKNKTKRIGFNINQESRINDKESETGKGEDISLEKLVASGLLPTELAGRIHGLAHCHPLDTKALLRILTEPDNSIVSQYKRNFKLDDIILDFEEAALKEVAQMAFEQGFGARSLRSILEKTLREIRFLSPSCKQLKHIIITEAGIKNYKLSIFRDDLGNNLDIDLISNCQS